MTYDNLMSHAMVCSFAILRGINALWMHSEPHCQLEEAQPSAITKSFMDDFSCDMSTYIYVCMAWFYGIELKWMPRLCHTLQHLNGFINLLITNEPERNALSCSCRNLLWTTFSHGETRTWSSWNRRDVVSGSHPCPGCLLLQYDKIIQRHRSHDMITYKKILKKITLATNLSSKCEQGSVWESLNNLGKKKKKKHFWKVSWRKDTVNKTEYGKFVAFPVWEHSPLRGKSQPRCTTK